MNRKLALQLAGYLLGQCVVVFFIGLHIHTLLGESALALGSGCLSTYMTWRITGKCKGSFRAFMTGFPRGWRQWRCKHPDMLVLRDYRHQQLHYYCVECGTSGMCDAPPYEAEQSKLKG